MALTPTRKPYFALTRACTTFVARAGRALAKSGLSRKKGQSFRGIVNVLPYKARLAVRPTTRAASVRWRGTRNWSRVAICRCDRRFALLCQNRKLRLLTLAYGTATLYQRPSELRGGSHPGPSMDVSETESA